MRENRLSAFAANVALAGNERWTRRRKGEKWPERSHTPSKYKFKSIIINARDSEMYYIHCVVVAVDVAGNRGAMPLAINHRIHKHRSRQAGKKGFSNPNNK